MRAVAFCPGHITGFFQICTHENPLQSGSRGAGFCLSLGATSEVIARNGSGKINIIINGEKARGKVTKDAISYVLQDRKMDLWISTTLDLPVSQGFGMSAAGSLSAAYALAELLGVEKKEAFKAAHIAEVVNHTGLGDVAAISRGGVTFRKKEGLPPFGEVERIASTGNIVAAAVGASLKTSDVLLDPEKREKINSAGQECYLSLSERPTIKNLMKQSRKFSQQINAIPEKVEQIVREVEEYGSASVAMLGNSVFGLGQVQKQRTVLEKYGRAFKMKVDAAGPRIVSVGE